jgi:leucyl/phenylalanyl-tRNA--protein transferase
MSSLYRFPDPNTALLSPNGLLAIGGDLAPERLLAAYRQGIFPWFNEGEPIHWWSPDPRAVLWLENFRISRSLAKLIRQKRLQVTFNQAFTAVIKSCAAMRKETGTWITVDMISAYTQLHLLGHAHSVEVWQENELVGGLYGIAVGKVFCGESMFSKVSNASKVAMAYLVDRLKANGFILIDCQLPNPHLLSLGATTIARQEFLGYLSAKS